MEGAKGNHAEERREFWGRHIAECRGSGLSYAEYCRRHDLAESTFTYWRKRFSVAQQGRSGFVELKVSAHKRSDIEIILRNQIRLSVCSDFDEVLLKKLIGVVETV